MTNAYRKIGEGVTDSNGRITVSYTGKGAGKIQLVAKQGSLLSETYELTDAQFISDGNLNCSANGQVTINNDTYTLGLIDTSNYGFVYYSTSNVGSNKWIWLSEGNTTEFEILDKTGTVSLRFDGSMANDTVWTVNITTGKVRIVHNGSTVSIYVDGELVTSVNITNEDKNPRFRVNANSSITLRNWMNY